MPLATIDSHLEQIDQLVRNAADYDDLEFRLRLEDLVKKGGRDTENAIALYITGTYVSIPTRMNLMRMAGYIRSTAFLIPLKKVIELGENDRLREGAIISISKYNDRRALDILAQALEKNKNKQLQEAIVQAINRIKHNNPLLNMLPRFLQGGKNSDFFFITLKVFKRILSPDDAKGFISYLQHEDPLVADGSFEILCCRGDETAFIFINEFFRERSRGLIGTVNQPESAEALAKLIAALHEYLNRYPDFFPQLRQDIVALRSRAGGSLWGERLAALLAGLENGSGAP